MDAIGNLFNGGCLLQYVDSAAFLQLYYTATFLAYKHQASLLYKMNVVKFILRLLGISACTHTSIYSSYIVFALSVLINKSQSISIIIIFILSFLVNFHTTMMI